MSSYRRNLSICTMLVCSTSASADCAVIDSVANAVYTVAYEALQRKEFQSAQLAARMFWEIRGAVECPLGKALGAALDSAKLSSAGTGALACAKVEVPSGSGYVVSGTVTYKTLAPKEVVVNGARYQLLAKPSDASVARKDVDELVADPTRDKIGKFHIDREALMKWQSLVKSK